jgi:hypothetical protein
MPDKVVNDYPKLNRVGKSAKAKAAPASNTSKSLSEWRKELKTEIEGTEIGGKRLFEVWINEDTAPQGGTSDSWETCMNAAKDCDIFIALSNGDAGWVNDNGTLGICHAELMTANSIGAAKVRVISLGNIPLTDDAVGERNKRFQEYLSLQSAFSPPVKTGAGLLDTTRAALHDAVLRLVQAGVGVASKGKSHMGQALDWSRLDFASRKAEMESVLRDAVLDISGSLERTGEIFIALAGCEILLQLHAIPAAITVGPARELVGQPFLKDYRLSVALVGDRCGGPLHIIACQKTATESQAQRFLGFPDATLVSAPFGVFVADPVQKMQFAFITNCRDDASTRHGLQRFLEWLHQTGEDQRVAARAVARARIVKVIAEVAQPPHAPNPGVAVR